MLIKISIFIIIYFKMNAVFLGVFTLNWPPVAGPRHLDTTLLRNLVPKKSEQNPK
jgi:hypothetical protein